MPVELPHRPGSWIHAPLSAAHADGREIDPVAENAAPIAAIQARHAERPNAPLIVIPGYTPVDAKTPFVLTDATRSRLRSGVAALREKDAVGILVTGGNVHPDDTPFNEAWEMRRHLCEALDIPRDLVVIDPYARHSTTNLRNAGRFLLAYGLPRALIVTDFGQGFYFGAPNLSTFNLRCREELGYDVGTMEPAPWFTRIRYVPSAEVNRVGADPLDP
jgi:hypothetical protein